MRTGVASISRIVVDTFPLYTEYNISIALGAGNIRFTHPPSARFMEAEK